jgi:hypothetical protein
MVRRRRNPHHHERSKGQYSAKCVEGEFSEVHIQDLE